MQVLREIFQLIVRKEAWGALPNQGEGHGKQDEKKMTDIAMTFKSITKTYLMTNKRILY